MARDQREIAGRAQGGRIAGSAGRRAQHGLEEPGLGGDHQHGRHRAVPLTDGTGEGHHGNARHARLEHAADHDGPGVGQRAGPLEVLTVRKVHPVDEPAGVDQAPPLRVDQPHGLQAVQELGVLGHQQLQTPCRVRRRGGQRLHDPGFQGPEQEVDAVDGAADGRIGDLGGVVGRLQVARAVERPLVPEQVADEREHHRCRQRRHAGKACRHGPAFVIVQPPDVVHPRLLPALLIGRLCRRGAGRRLSNVNLSTGRHAVPWGRRRQRTRATTAEKLRKAAAVDSSTMRATRPLSAW